MTCPGPETLAAMAEQRLDAPERDAALDHAAGCDDCRHTLMILGGLKPAATVRLRRVERPWIPWAAAAAVFAVCVLAVLLTSRRTEEPTTVRIPAPKEQPRPEPERPKPVVPVETPKPDPAPKRDDPAPAPKDPVTPLPPKPTPEVPAKPAPERPAPPVEPTPEKPAPPKPVTISVVAVLDRAEGEVFVGGAPAKAGQEIRHAQGIECKGARSWALLSYPDKTRMEIEGDTLVREILGREPGKGLRILIDRGAVKADVAKQPAGQPLIFETPHGDAKVLGTTLRLSVDPDPKKGTRLDVEEGKVELRNSAGKAALVEAGHSAVAAAGIAPSAKRLPKEEVLYAMDFEDGKKPAALSKGTVVTGPDRRICYALDSDAGGTCKVTLGEDPDGLCVFSGEEILSFDYWVDAQASAVNYHFWNRTQKVTHEGEVPKIVAGKWTRVTIRLAEVGDPAARMKDGDWIAYFFLHAAGGPPRKFYIDNLSLTRPRSLKPRPVETK